MNASEDNIVEDLANTSLLAAKGQSLISHALAADYIAAQVSLNELHQLRGRFPAYAVLRNIATGKMVLKPYGKSVCIGIMPDSAELVGQLDAAINSCAQWLKISPPQIVLHCLPDQSNLHYTLQCFPGLAIIRLSSLAPGFPNDLRSVVFHEVAHAFLSCGVRLLDEGLANFFATQFIELSVPPIATKKLPDVRTLLSAHGEAMFGESADSDPEIYQAAVGVGTELIKQLIAVLGVNGLPSFFASVSQCTCDAEIVEQIEAALGKPLPLRLPSATMSLAEEQLITRTRRAIFAAWMSKIPQELDIVIAELEAADYMSHQGLIDCMLSVSINRAFLYVNAGVKPGADELAHLDYLLNEAQCLTLGRLWLWRACRAMLTITLVRPNLIKVATAGQQAMQAFSHAAELIPDDPDLLIQHAVLLINTPEKYGGDLDLGLSKLRRAMENPEYRLHVIGVLEKYGHIEPQPIVSANTEAGADAVSNSSTTSMAHAAVVLSATNVSLTLDSNFWLRPTDLILLEGERIGIVGPNGSGKTMLLETLLGLRTPDMGRIELVPEEDGEPRQHIGGLLQGGDLPADIKVREIMRMHEVVYQQTDKRVTLALGLDDLRNRTWKQLSRGQKQRVLLWLALSHVPKLVLLDEPSLGLDEWFSRRLRDLLLTLPCAVILISHQATDLLAVDRILCMTDGRIVDQGFMSDLIDRHVGAFKAFVRQTLDDDARQAFANLSLLRHAPRQMGDGWLCYGGAGFDQVFRAFIDRYRIQAFSLECTGIDDFLAEVSRT
ncbi:ATP-binding cassette domain-containing protein [Undibacterium sp. SXout11W]|uniref:ATP-binding cassette domain-containing protein n=1 Tax=Undibacterium sp. SXout11W TaxID=3413050 RepID=UPI003BF2B120